MLNVNFRGYFLCGWLRPAPLVVVVIAVVIDVVSLMIRQAERLFWVALCLRA